jgi:hypothetical protein
MEWSNLKAASRLASSSTGHFSVSMGSPTELICPDGFILKKICNNYSLEINIFFLFYILLRCVQSEIFIKMKNVPAASTINHLHFHVGPLHTLLRINILRNTNQTVWRYYILKEGYLHCKSYERDKCKWKWVQVWKNLGERWIIFITFFAGREGGL